MSSKVETKEREMSLTQSDPRLGAVVSTNERRDYKGRSIDIDQDSISSSCNTLTKIFQGSYTKFTLGLYNFFNRRNKRSREYYFKGFYYQQDVTSTVVIVSRSPSHVPSMVNHQFYQSTGLCSMRGLRD